MPTISNIAPDVCSGSIASNPYMLVSNTQSLQAVPVGTPPAVGTFSPGKYVAEIIGTGFSSHGLTNPVNGEHRIRGISINSDWSATNPSVQLTWVKGPDIERVSPHADMHGNAFDELWVSSPLSDGENYILLSDLDTFVGKIAVSHLISYTVSFDTMTISFLYDTVYFDDIVPPAKNNRVNIIFT